MGEEWRPVAGEFAGWPVEVSSIGRVRSAAGTRYSGRVRKLCHDKDGYRVVTMCHQHRQVVVKVHKLVAEAFIGLRPPGLVVNHKDGVRTNNIVSNIEWVTAKYNVRDGWARGRRHHGKKNYTLPCISGENHYIAKFTDAEIRLIRSLRNQGVRCTEIHELIPNGCHRTIGKICRRESWKHIT